VGEEVTERCPASRPDRARFSSDGAGTIGSRLDDFEPVTLEADELHRIVRQDANRRQAEVEEDLRADAVVS